jgi:hypothetical protein
MVSDLKEGTWNMFENRIFRRMFGPKRHEVTMVREKAA